MRQSWRHIPAILLAPRSWRRPGIRRTTLFALSLAFAFSLALAAWLAWPLPSAVANPGPVPSVVLQDRHGLVLRTTRATDGSRGGWVPYARVDPDVIRAFLAMEDRRFFHHHGVDLRAVVRAAGANLRAGHVVSGASTLTMQTARLLHPLPRTWAGKVAQALWALRLEAHLSKTRILELYLNRVPLGQGAVGVAAAARLYFGATAEDLSPGQAALLAALAHAPSRDNPLVARRRAEQRRNTVLARMAAVGYLTPEELSRARQEPVLAPTAETRFLAPHFTTRVLLAAAGAGGAGQALSSDLASTSMAAAARAGSHSRSRPSSALESPLGSGDVSAVASGVWRTTLDLDLQRALEAEVRHTVDLLRDRGARQAALVVLDNRSGGVLAWVGSPDFWSDASGQVDMVVSPRQPGSALKPFLYGMAFDHGYTPATVLPDIPHTYATSTGPYRPQNYDRRFHGPVRIRQALASSFNVPAVELTDRLGAGALLSTLHEAGFAALNRTAAYYGLGLALGNGEVTLLELANAYRGLANGGVWRPVHWLLDSEDWNAGTGGARFTAVGAGPGGPRSARVPGGRRFMSAGAAALVLDILSDPVARIPGFGIETPFDFPFPAAAKTGTSRHFTDNWAVATTAAFTVAVWVGNFNGQPMEGVSGVSGAGPLLYRSVLQTARRYPPGYLPRPEQAGAAALPVCILSGLRATPDCASMIEWFLPGTEPTREDDWERASRTILPPEYAEWERSNQLEEGLPRAAGGTATGPARFATNTTLSAVLDSATGRPVAARHSVAAGEAAAYTLVSPRNGDRYQVPPGVPARYATIPLTAVGAAPDETPRWYVDGRLTRSARWQLRPGQHTFRVVWPSGHTAEATILVE